MFKKLAIGLGAIIIIAAVVICAIPLKTVSYTVSVSYQDVENYVEPCSRNLFSGDTYLVRLGDYMAIREFLPCEVEPREALVVCERDYYPGEEPIVISGIAHCRGQLSCEGRVYLSIVETQGYDINLYVLDEENYDKWRQGQQFGISYTLLEPRTGPIDGFEFTIRSPGYYYFVLENLNTWVQRDKIVELTASYYWEEVKQITLTKYRQEIRYKRVTIIEYYTSY